MEIRTVAITGGTKGIGAGISRAFHAAGWNVLIGARNDNGLAADLGERARFEPLDVREPTALEAFAETAVAWSGRLDAWVNCAGFSAWRPVEDIDAAFWSDMVAINLTGTFFGCKTAAARLPDGGSIINVSSLAGKRGSANNTAYCASKFGVNGITQALAKELGARGIRVNAVCPVYVPTEGVLRALADPRSPAGGQDVERYLADFTAGQTALKRLPTSGEVGAMCVFLASDAASAVTGQCINVDCGVLPQ